ncbi:uncharacterized protein [Dysidea avara]
MSASRDGDNSAIQKLIGKGVDIANTHFENWYNQTPLHLSAWGGHIDVATSLIEQGAEVEALSSVNSTPLNVAAYHGQCDMLNLLLKSGAKCDSTDWGHHTPLYWAARRGHTDITDRLILANADLEKPEMSRHWTPLHAASYHGNLDIVKLLVDAGADFDATDKDGNTPLQLALQQKHTEVVQYFVEDTKMEATQLDEHQQLMIDSLMMKMDTRQCASSIIPALAIETSLYSNRGNEGFKRKTAISYQEALKIGTRASNQFKLILLGVEGAGKTSTVDSLLNKPFNPDQASTIGADLNKCTVDRILVSKWKQTEVKDHMQDVVKQYRCEMKSCMNKVSRKPVEEHLSKGTFKFTYSQATFAEAKVVIESKPFGGSSDVKIIIYDLGGQEIYQVLRCLFLASEDIAFVVFDASIGLDGHVKNRQRWTRFKRKVEAKGTQTNLEAIEMLLNSVYSQCSIKSAGSTSNRTPVIVLIATHAKDLTSEQKEEMKDTIYEKFSGRPFMDHLPKSKDDAIHFIDNAVRDMKVFEHLKEVVLAAADCVIKKKCPIPYLKFESEILNVSLTKTTITKQEASEIAIKSNLQDDIEFVLHHFHQKGILQYYSRVKSLQNEVFISPQEVSDNVSTVISTHNCEPNSARLQKSCNRYETYGILEEALLDHMLEACNRTHKKNILLGLLEMFNLAVVLHKDTRFIDEDQSYSTPVSGRVFLIPSMLTYNEKKIYHKKDGDIVIQFHFPDKFLPETIFNRVLVKTVVWCNKNDHEIRGIYHGSGHFDFKDRKQCFRLQQCSTTFSIKCFITVDQQRATNEFQLQEMLKHRNELVAHLQCCVSEVHHSCIPSAEKPIAYLECPLIHEPDYPPHIQLDQINDTDEVLCRPSNNQPIPKEAYILLCRVSYCETDPDMPYSDCADFDDDTVMELLWELNPEMNKYINLDCLLPYLNRHKVLTRSERFCFNNSSKSQNEKIAYLLQVLDGKDSGTVLKFIRALKEETEHTGHMKLYSLLAQRRGRV